MNDNLKEREAFEAWYEKSYGSPVNSRTKDVGTYGEWHVRREFDAYLAGRLVIEASRAAVPAGPDVQWQKRHPLRTEGAWENTNEHDAKWWRDNSRGWEIRMLTTAPQPAAQPGERWHVGDSAFESWFANYCPAGKGDKQRARDAYAAGMGDRAPVTQAKPEQAAQPLTPAQIEALEREASELVAPPEMTESMCLEWLVRKVEAAHGIAAPQPKD